MQGGLSERLSSISLLHFGKNHPEQSSKHPGFILLWQNMFASFAAHGKVGVVQGSKKEGFTEGHGQAKPRDVLVPPWTICFNKLRPLS